MKQWFSIVSLCMVAVFTFSSVLQFHHHDADGNVVVYDVNAPFSIESHSFCKHHHCADHDSNHDDDCCTLKLSTQKASRPTTVQSDQLCFSLLFIGILNHTIGELFADASTPHFIQRIIGSLSSIKHHIVGLRAPPYCH